MRAKPKPLKDLYFRFGEAFGLHWNQVADCLYRADLIEYIPDRDSPYSFTYYRDTDRLRRILKGDDPQVILRHIFNQYKNDQGLEDET